ncbi:hypothetical protein PAHAL_2G072800 [Panicum hallii]|uniref:F-box domain-containing protein n=1 Tax=Panicum hallii TaxID=206008 RepID=A0A2S3GWJ6_9POAL|nr:uncharacterized protein LOC112881536 isoform X2 [Panicum hallii]PAN10121.1 hypothetical protein PAHAL_2G072800 [Panicum hallii]PAN10122.1 hypothetical protein PAHAL_2G072800 [Panicum hallii]
MAPPRPRSPPTTRAMRARAAASSDRIPPDVLFDVLLRLPARDLCRLRAVSRSWRALASDPLFVAAHAARHGGPLFLAMFQDDKTSVYAVDLSGDVVKRVAAGAGGGPYHRLLCTRLDLGCLATDWNRVAATGEHKVFRMFNRLGFHNGGQQIFEVFTINGGTDHARWRGRQGPGLFIDECSGVAVNGVVYFLTSRVYEGACCGIRPDYIVSFDLGREEWMRDLRGPISSNAGYAKVSLYTRHQLALAELKGSLVLADHHHQPFTMDLWFLSDFRSGLWVKQYHIRIESLNLRSADEYHLKPLLVLDDGRLVLYLAPTGQVVHM